MKKMLVIIAVLFTLNCSAASSIRFPIFTGKHKYKREARMVRCGSKDKFKKGRRQVIKHVTGMVIVFVTLGLVMDNN